MIHKLWDDIEIDKMECDCHTCRKHWGMTECERITRQRRLNSPIRTCPVCKKEIPKEKYEKPKKSQGIEFYIGLHQEDCAYKHGIKYGDCRCGKCEK